MRERIPAGEGKPVPVVDMLVPAVGHVLAEEDKLDPVVDIPVEEDRLVPVVDILAEEDKHVLVVDILAEEDIPVVRIVVRNHPEGGMPHGKDILAVVGILAEEDKRVLVQGMVHNLPSGEVSEAQQQRARPQQVRWREPKRVRTPR